MKGLWCKVVGHRWVRGRATLIMLPTAGLGFLWKPVYPPDTGDGRGCTRCGHFRHSTVGDGVLYGAGRSE